MYSIYCNIHMRARNNTHRPFNRLSTMGLPIFPIPHCVCLMSLLAIIIFCAVVLMIIFSFDKSHNDETKFSAHKISPHHFPNSNRFQIVLSCSSNNHDAFGVLFSIQISVSIIQFVDDEEDKPNK